MTVRSRLAGGVARSLPALVVGLWLTAALSASAAPPVPILIDDTGVFPESLTATAKGEIIVGSSAKGAIYKAAPGAAKAGVWIDPKASGMAAVLGVFADDKSRTLYACSVAFGAPHDKADALSALRTFDLDTGVAKAAYPMPGGGKALCNDIAIDRSGAAYVSETLGGRVLKLAKGASALAEWVKDPQLAGVDGIAIGGDGAVYLNSVQSGRMFRIGVAPDGTAGPITELAPSLKLTSPDGLRSLGGLRFLQAENSGVGRIEVVTVSGDKAEITPLKSGEAGLTSAAVVKGQVWAVNAKFAYRRDPALKDKDPNPFTVEPVAALPSR
jgi:hypothetical protein